MGQNLVVDSASLTCTQLSGPLSSGKLTVTSQSKTKAQGKLVATQDDKVYPTNISSMGSCLIISGGGVGPCVPVISGNWTPNSTKVKCNNKKCLLKNDTLICSAVTPNGSISISDAKQTKIQGV